MRSSLTSNLTMVNSPLGYIWLLVKTSYICIHMACINYKNIQHVLLLLCWRPPTVAPGKSLAAVNSNVSKQIVSHPYWLSMQACICLPGVSSSVYHMFRIAETGNLVWLLNALRKLGCEENILILACRTGSTAIPLLVQTNFILQSEDHGTVHQLAHHLMKISLWPGSTGLWDANLIIFLNGKTAFVSLVFAWWGKW